MKDQPLVSIVTATYNMADFLSIAIDSIQNQTYQNFQHIIIDDGSVDKTDEVVKKYLADDRVEYYYQENQGQTVAKNNGIKHAKGEYVCFLDADNIWELDKLEKQISIFRDIGPTYQIIYTHQLYIDGDGNKLNTPDIERFSGKISNELLFENFVTFNTVMVRKECFDELGGFDENLPRSIDYELWLRFSTKYQFYYYPEVTTHYRIWDGQMSQDKDKRYKYALRIMGDFIKENPDILDASVVGRAWCHAFTCRGRHMARKAKYLEATKLFVRALRYNPFYRLTWKSIARMFLTMLGFPADTGGQ